MKAKILFYSIVLFLCPSLLFSQIEKTTSSLPSKNQLGIQFNPVYEHSRGIYKDIVFSIRYGYKITTPVTIGTEITNSFPNRYVNMFKTDLSSMQYKIKVGIFARYTMFSERRIQPFLEISPYYMDVSLKTRDDAPQYLHDFRERGVKLYIAPGVSLYSKNKKYSLDLMYKLPFQTPGYFERRDFSYKFNFHF